MEGKDQYNWSSLPESVDEAPPKAIDPKEATSPPGENMPASYSVNELDVSEYRGPSIRRSYRLLVLAGILTSIVIATFFFLGSRRQLPGPIASVYESVSSMLGQNEYLQNNYRLYSRSLGNAPTFGYNDSDQSKYTLVDDKGNKVLETPPNKSLGILTTLGDGAFLFANSNFIGYQDKYPAYAIITKERFSWLSNAPATMKKIMEHRSSGLPRIVGIGGTKVAYQYCKDPEEMTPDEADYQCELHYVDVLKGDDFVQEQPRILNEYKAKLLAISSDRKSAYFLGISKEDEASFSSKVNAITGGGVHYEDNPEFQDVYKLKATLSVLKMDLSSNKVGRPHKVQTEYTYYGKFWLSPNGQHLVYSNGGERGELHYVSVADGTQGVIKLPGANQASEPWSGETTSYDPLFSPDGNYMAYVTYDFGTGYEYMGIIDLRSRTAKEIAKRPLGEWGKADPGAFGNMRWFANNQLEMSFGGDNYKVDAPKGIITKAGNAYGTLVGFADGAR